MVKVAIIILNYMTWNETLKEVDLIKKVIKDVQFEYEIIVIDNCSPNESYDKLKVHSDKFTLIKSDTNGGYASGNNIALKYAFDKGYDYSLILNNDVIIDDVNIIQKLVNVFEYDKNIAVVSPDILSPEGYLYNRDAYRPNMWDLTLGMVQYRRKGRAEEDAKNGWLFVYRPQGCCMLVDNKKLAQVGYMDEYTFLYCEEIILAERLLKNNYKCACCSSASVIHDHSYTVKKTLSKIKFVKSNLNSFKYYLREYRKYNWFSRFICSAFYALKTLITS